MSNIIPTSSTSLSRRPPRLNLEQRRRQIQASQEVALAGNEAELMAALAAFRVRLLRRLGEHTMTEAVLLSEREALLANLCPTAAPTLQTIAQVTTMAMVEELMASGVGR